MRARFSLPARILLLALLNIVLVAALAAAAISSRYGLDWPSIVVRISEDRIVSMGRALALELRQVPGSEREAVVRRISAEYQTALYLFLNSGEQLAGPHVELPEAVRRALEANPPPPPPPDFRGPRPEPPGRRPLIHVKDPETGAEWVGVRIPVGEQSTDRVQRGTVLMSASGIAGSSVFVHPGPWLWTLAAAAALTVACWAPFLRNLTRSVRRLTRAAGEIAEGRFDVELDTGRTDEIGQLSVAVRRMADRLALFVNGQKRFLGDVAHELCSPIARMQFAIGILEQKAGSEALTDLQDEVQQLSGLVEEVLQFSRASMQTGGRSLTPVALLPLVREVLRREGAESEVSIPEDLHAMADAGLLQRAVANLVRNAVRHAGEHGPVAVTAVRADDKVRICVADQGPGIPAEELDRVFAPFYRPDVSRSRESGGFGLGLAIVRTCAENCGGAVVCRNRSPRGLEAEITLAAG